MLAVFALREIFVTFAEVHGPLRIESLRGIVRGKDIDVVLGPAPWQQTGIVEEEKGLTVFPGLR